jgi:hypothetical protein
MQLGLNRAYFNTQCSVNVIACTLATLPPALSGFVTVAQDVLAVSCTFRS